MAYGFLDIASTPSVRAARAANGASRLWDDTGHDRSFDRFTASEAAFIAARDSFYVASASETGWPYVQHRGGPAGFLRVLDETHLGFADYRGNRQYISLGNITADDQVCLFLMDYPNRARLKIYAHAEVVDLRAEPDLAQRLATPGYRALPERGIILRLAAFDWNCAQHITPRFTAAEIDVALAPLQTRLAALEAENQALRDQIASSPASEHRP